MHGRLRARPGALVARRRPARLQRQAPGARHGRASSRSWRAPIRRVPAMADAGVNRVINGPEGFTPDNEFILGESRGPRVLRRRRVLGPRDRRGRRDRPPDGDLDRRWRARARPVEDGHPPVRAGLSEPGATRSPARSRTTRPTTTSTTRTRSARPAARCGLSPTYDRLAGARRGVRREVRLGAPELVRAERRRPGDEALASARLGRRALVARRSAPRRSRRGPTAALFDETSLRQDRGRRAGRLRLPQHLCANDVDVALGRIVYTSLLNRRGGIECDLTVTRSRPTAS